jgi:hypothetical protein
VFTGLKYQPLFPGFYSIKNVRRFAMTFHGRLTEGKKRAYNILDGGVRPWRVTRDPSEMFLNGVFRVNDLMAGGFDEGTIFTHIGTGERRVVGADGVLRKMNNGKEKVRRHRNRHKVICVKPIKPVVGNRGTNAIL